MKIFPSAGFVVLEGKIEEGVWIWGCRGREEVEVEAVVGWAGVELAFEGTVVLWMRVRMLEVWVRVCRVMERRFRRVCASDFSLRERSSEMMCVMLSMTMSSTPELSF